MSLKVSTSPSLYHTTALATESTVVFSRLPELEVNYLWELVKLSTSPTLALRNWKRSFLTLSSLPSTETPYPDGVLMSTSSHLTVSLLKVLSADRIERR